MWKIDISGFRKLEINYLVFDFNGTLAVDGVLFPDLKEQLVALSHQFEIHVLTADTFGKAAEQLQDIPCRLEILPAENQAEAKCRYVQKLGSEQTIAIGNGRNDRLMLGEAVVGIVVLQNEGASSETLLTSDVICRNIFDTLNLLTHPKRLVATLRD